MFIRQTDRFARRRHVAVARSLAVVALLGSLVVLSSAASASASDKKPVRAVVMGTLDCSDLLDVSTGYGGSPLSLALKSESSIASVSYPSQLKVPGSSLFGTPQDEQYRFAVTIPAGQSSVPIDWRLTCQDQDGTPAPPESGHFTLSRTFSPTHPATRDICNHGGSVGIVISTCNPKLTDKLGECGWAIYTAGAGSDVLDLASDVAQRPKTALHRATTALSEVTGTLGGLLIACAPLAASSAPTATTSGGHAVSLDTLCRNSNVVNDSVNGCPYNGSAQIGTRSFAYEAYVSSNYDSVNPSYWELLGGFKRSAQQAHSVSPLA
jgi:hypothetical protein